MIIQLESDIKLVNFNVLTYKGFYVEKFFNTTKNPCETRIDEQVIKKTKISSNTKKKYQINFIPEKLNKN